MQQPEGTVPLEIRWAVAERAGCRCEVCGKPGNHDNPQQTGIGLDLHHKNGIRGPGHDTLANLIMVCDSCHAAVGKKACPECGRLCGAGAYLNHVDAHVTAAMRQRLMVRVGQTFNYVNARWSSREVGELIEVPPSGKCRLRMAGRKTADKTGLFDLIWANPALLAEYRELKLSLHRKWRAMLYSAWEQACADCGGVVDYGPYLSRCPTDEYKTMLTNLRARLAALESRNA